MMAGVTAGVGAFVSFPVIGGVQGGPVGAVAGVGAGCVSAVALPVYGVVAGASQIVSGIVNTPMSISESVAWGRQWDEDEGIYIFNILRKSIMCFSSLPHFNNISFYM